MDDPGHQISLNAEVSIPDSLTEASLASLIEFVLRREQVKEAWILSFRFTGDEGIQRMHREFMGLDSPTDIMTFPYLSEHEQIASGDQDMAGGDIIISVDRASAQAIEAGWSTLDELRFLSIHGVLHLAGWDDHDPEARAAMLDRQAALLVQWMNASHKDVALGGDNRSGDVAI